LEQNKHLKDGIKNMALKDEEVQKFFDRKKSKINSNKVQSDNNQGAIKVQSDSNQGAIKVQSDSNQGAIKVQSGCKSGCNPNSSSSSNNNIYKTTTTGEEVSKYPEWGGIDITPLTKIGFTRDHLLHIANMGKLSPEEVQNSIHAFAFDLEKNNKSEKLTETPLNAFVGILRKGSTYPPTPV
jgi:hypothetical protein